VKVFFVIFTIIKAIIILIGFGLVVKHLSNSIRKKVPGSKTKAVKAFLFTGLIIIILTVLEFLIAFMNNA